MESCKDTAFIKGLPMVLIILSILRFIGLIVSIISHNKVTDFSFYGFFQITVLYWDSEVKQLL